MVKATELFKAWKADARQTLADIREALDRGRKGEPGGLRPEDFSIRNLAAEFIMDRDGNPIGLRGLESLCGSQRFLEGDGALASSAFAAITGQVVNAAIQEGYRLPAFALSGAVPVLPGRTEQARIVGVSLPLAEGKSLEVQQGQEYPSLGMYDEYALTPRTVKRGALVAITKEAVLADDTGQILDQARRLGEIIGLQKETALVDYAIGAVSNCVTERRVGDSSEVTSNLFLTSGRWVNQQVNALADWTDFDDAEALFLGITMPGSGRPPILVERTVLVPPQLRSRVARILSATETRSGSTNVVVAGNPMAGLGVQMIASELVYTRLVASGVAGATAAGTWFYGDLRRALRYYENWPLTVEEDRSREPSFTHDVLVRFKASEKGTPVVVEPRVWSKQTPS